MRLALGAPLTAADLAWLQAAFAGAGLLACCASFHLACTEAALGSFCLLLCQVTHALVDGPSHTMFAVLQQLLNFCTRLQRSLQSGV